MQHNNNNRTLPITTRRSVYNACMCVMLHPSDPGPQRHLDGLVQERGNSIANVLELHVSCIDPLIWSASFAMQRPGYGPLDIRCQQQRPSQLIRPPRKYAARWLGEGLPHTCRLLIKHIILAFWPNWKHTQYWLTIFIFCLRICINRVDMWRHT